MNVFNEKTLAALRTHGFENTDVFAQHITRLINILNVGSPNVGGRFNDPDHAVVNSVDDQRLNFLLEMANSFQRMDTKNTKYKHRIMCLTSDTSYDLVITIRGLVSMVSELLANTEMKYIMNLVFSAN